MCQRGQTASTEQVINPAIDQVGTVSIRELKMSSDESATGQVRGDRRTLGACWIVYGIFRLIVGICLVLFNRTATVMFGALLTRVPNPYTLMADFHIVYVGMRNPGGPLRTIRDFGRSRATGKSAVGAHARTRCGLLVGLRDPVWNYAGNLYPYPFASVTRCFSAVIRIIRSYPEGWILCHFRSFPGRFFLAVTLIGSEFL